MKGKQAVRILKRFHHRPLLLLFGIDSLHITLKNEVFIECQKKDYCEGKDRGCLSHRNISRNFEYIKLEARQR